MNKLAPTIAAVVFDSGGVLLKHRHAFLDSAAICEALRELCQEEIIPAVSCREPWLGAAASQPPRGAHDARPAAAGKPPLPARASSCHRQVHRKKVQPKPIDEQRIAQATRDALDWLSNQAGSTTTEESAAAQRMEYYRRLLAGVNATASPELVVRLCDRLEGPESVEPFPEVREVLDALCSHGLKLGVLSDGWASTVQLYERLGLAGCFQSWTFSAVVGCCKPDPRIYAAAERDLGIEPAQILFVDDLPANIEGALRCGWQALWLNRAGDQPSIHPSRTIRSLRELTTMVFVCAGT